MDKSDRSLLIGIFLLIVIVETTALLSRFGAHR